MLGARISARPGSATASRCRTRGWRAVARPYGILGRLREPVDFEAVDDRPVDLVFLLLLPAPARHEQLNALACVARRLRDAETAAAMRGARDAAGLYAAVTGG